MRRRHYARGACGGLVLGAIVFIAGAAVDRSQRDDDDPHDLTRAAEIAISNNAGVAKAATDRLRAAGPVGLEALVNAHRALLTRANQPRAALSEQDQQAWQRLELAIDQVSGQRYGYASGLFWYTDFDQALAAAREQNKPILSLRLLGKLTDEYSCANSRFFRTALYANAEIGKFLRERFVMHWQSVRPVPQVTIDFGDGRRIKTTLTGNSIHYVLDRDGRLIDALPGLYGPQAFLGQLSRGAEAARALSALPEKQRPAALADHHRRRVTAIESAWAFDLQRVGVSAAPRSVNQPPGSGKAPRQAAAAAPPARVAAALAVPKSAIELRTINAMAKNDLAPPAAPNVDANWLSANTSDERWLAIAELNVFGTLLDEASIEIMRRQQPSEDIAPPIIFNFQKLMALDTVRNEYLFHRQIHRWFANGEVGTLDALNQRVYAELFLTPRADPWLGLIPEGAYLALPSNGLSVPE